VEWLVAVLPEAKAGCLAELAARVEGFDEVICAPMTMSGRVYTHRAFDQGV
jgi:hypothetical protein